MKTQTTNDQTDDGLTKYAESNLQSLQNPKLSQEEWIERSWAFLTAITDLVEKLPKDVQDKILECGRQLASIGASYNHDDKKPHRPPISPAKMAAMNELKTQASGASQ